MFERISGLPAPDDGIRGAALHFRPGAQPDAAFLARVVEQLSQPRDVLGRPLASLAGLGEDVGRFHATHTLLQPGCPGRDEGLRLVHALATSLYQRFGGGGEPFVMEWADSCGTISFDQGGDFLASFSLLYSVSFVHHFWLEGRVEPRLNQVLEVASLFFSTEADALVAGLPELDGHFPQEVLNSFVNLIHPHPRHLGNQLTKILLLEDNHELGEIVADMLSSVGYVVCQAPDGISGLHRLEHERFQLILSDIQMPRLNGLGLLKALRDMHLEVPVVLTTGFTSVWQEDQALQQGAVAFLPKPFGMVELIQTVERILTGQPLAASR